MLGRLIPLWVRVAASFSALLAGLFLLVNLATYQTIERGFRQDLDTDLLRLGQAELSSALDGPDEQVHLHTHGASHRGVIYQPLGEIVAASPGLSYEQAQGMVNQALLHPGMSFFTLEGYRWTVIPAPQSHVPGARLVLSLPIAPLLRTLEQIRHSFYFWSLLGSQLAALLAALLARRLTRPLERISALAATVGQGHLDIRVPLTYESSEIHTLEQSLNEMLDSLQVSRCNLHERARQQRQFVADASHEMRTPLHGLQGTLEVALRRSRSAEEYQEVLQTALRETLRLSRLVQDMLLLSRHDLDRLELARKRNRLDLLLADCVQAYQARAKEEQVELLLTCGGEVEREVDPQRLRQILDNLVENALRHAPGRSPIELSLECHGHEVWLGVRDHGEGLQAQEYEDIFERFTRLDRARQHGTGGLGLGLAIARSLAAAHGGRLWGERHPDGGSIFRLALP